MTFQFLFCTFCVYSKALCLHKQWVNQTPKLIPTSWSRQERFCPDLSAKLSLLLTCGEHRQRWDCKIPAGKEQGIQPWFHQAGLTANKHGQQAQFMQWCPGRRHPFPTEAPIVWRLATALFSPPLCQDTGCLGLWILQHGWHDCFFLRITQQF